MNIFKRILMRITPNDEKRLELKKKLQHELYLRVYEHWDKLNKTEIRATAMTADKFDISDSMVLKAISYSMKFTGVGQFKNEIK